MPIVRSEPESKQTEPRTSLPATILTVNFADGANIVKPVSKELDTIEFMEDRIVIRTILKNECTTIPLKAVIWYQTFDGSVSYKNSDIDAARNRA
jgi:hypothetical protein